MRLGLLTLRHAAQQQLRGYLAPALLSALGEYGARNGHVRVPQSFVVPEEGGWAAEARGLSLGGEVRSLRRKKKKGALSDDSDEPLTVPVRDGLAVVPDVQRVGLYQLSWQEPTPGSMWIPVNLVSANESDLTREPADLLGSDVAVVAAEDAVEARHGWGWVLAIVALGFICFDVWWLTRTPAAARRRKKIVEEATT